MFLSVLLFGLISLCISYFAGTSFIVGAILGSVLMMVSSFVHWSEEQPGGIDNPELDGTHFPKQSLVVGAVICFLLLAVIYYFPQIQNYGFD